MCYVSNVYIPLSSVYILLSLWLCPYCQAFKEFSVQLLTDICIVEFKYI